MWVVYDDDFKVHGDRVGIAVCSNVSHTQIIQFQTDGCIRSWWIVPGTLNVDE